MHLATISNTKNDLKDGLYHWSPNKRVLSKSRNIDFPQFSWWKYIGRLNVDNNLWYIYENQLLSGEMLLYNISNPNWRNIVFIDRSNNYKSFIERVTNDPIFKLKIYIYQFISIFLKVFLKENIDDVLGPFSVDLWEEDFLKVYVDNLDIRFMWFLIFFI